MLENENYHLFEIVRLINLMIGRFQDIEIPSIARVHGFKVILVGMYE